MTKWLMQVRNAKKAFTDNEGLRLPVLDALTLEINRGEFLAILGPSGCGKTTLLNILCGQDNLDEGELVVAEQATQKSKLKTAVVWQGDSLMPWKTASGNVRFAVDVAAQDAGGDGRRASEWLDAVGLKDFEHFYPSQLSQGMRKRAILAAALAIEPDMLLMDEPFSALDVYTKLQVERHVVELLERLGTTTVMVTHDVEEAVALSDRIIVLTDRPARVSLVRDNPLPRPRDLQSLYGDAQFHEIVRELWLALTAKN